MRRRHNIVVSVTILFLGLAAAGLCFIAYAKRIKADDVTKNKEGACVYPGSYSAFALGILAAVLVLVEQIMVSSGTGCLCCSRNRFPCNCCGIIALILFICSWLSFVITEMGLVFTAIVNSSKYLGRIQNDNAFKPNSSVKHSKDGCLLGVDALFYGCAFWCLINLACSLICYATFVCGVKRSHKHHGVGNFNHV